MNLKDKGTFFMLLIAILWIAIMIMGWKGYWLIGMYSSVGLMIIHMMLGAAKNGKLDKKLFMYPLLSWAILWGISFYLSDYYAELYSGKLPNFTILGLHPSFAWTILTYWIGGVLTLTLGFILMKDSWLSEKEWQEFKDKIEEINRKEGGSYSDINS